MSKPEFEHLTRVDSFRRNDGLEGLLNELNGLLEPVERSVRARYTQTEWPIVLVVGAPRSGSTLLTQWLASLGHFAYPTNFLSRFYQAPYVGGLIQQMLTDPGMQFRDEFKETKDARLTFDSSLGKTSGIMAPNEFWYFWRRFFVQQDIHYIEQNVLDQVDSVTFNAELAALEAALGKPLAMKAMILGSNLEYLDRILNKVIFIYSKRVPFFGVQSLMEARRKYSGSVEEWYSLRPKEYFELKAMDPYRQVAGQIHYLNKRIEASLAEMAPERFMQIEYEDFCSNPKKYFLELSGKCRAQGCEIGNDYRGPDFFENTNSVNVAPDEVAKINGAVNYFASLSDKT